MSRSFRYKGTPDEIRTYLEDLGYEVDNIYTSSGKEIGFEVRNTTLQLSYPLTLENGHQVGFGLVRILTPMDKNGRLLDEEGKKDLIKLYQKLYRRFRKKQP